jgi:lipopolysaccharide transport system ATP-binding protein
MRPIISVKNLSKSYRLGKSRIGHGSLRDALSAVLSAPARYLRRPRRSVSETIWALKDVHFDVAPGEVLGIIGRNGAGKSTLLKILSRIIEPTQGSAELYGRVASLLEVGTGFHPELTGRENVFLSGAVLGMTRAHIKRTFDELVAFSEMEQFLETPVKRYSSGMYMRLAFAVAAHLTPDILVVDEVLAVGDVGFRDKCLRKMGTIARSGQTVIFVSHDLGAVTRLCSNAIWLDLGRVVRVGDPYELATEYERSQLQLQNCFPAIMERDMSKVQDSSFIVQKVQLLDRQGRHTCLFNYGEPLVMKVHLEGRCNTPTYSLEFRIYKHGHGLIAIGASGAFSDIYFDNATRDISVVIDPLVLTTGAYHLSLSLVAGETRPDTWDYACSFTVVACDPFVRGRDVSEGVCVLPHTFVLGP